MATPKLSQSARQFYETQILGSTHALPDTLSSAAIAKIKSVTLGKNEGGLDAAIYDGDGQTTWIGVIQESLCAWAERKGTPISLDDADAIIRKAKADYQANKSLGPQFEAWALELVVSGYAVKAGVQGIHKDFQAQRVDDYFNNGISAGKWVDHNAALAVLREHSVEPKSAVYNGRHYLAEQLEAVAERLPEDIAPNTGTKPHQRLSGYIYDTIGSSSSTGRARMYKLLNGMPDVGDFVGEDLQLTPHPGAEPDNDRKLFPVFGSPALLGMDVTPEEQAQNDLWTNYYRSFPPDPAIEADINEAIRLNPDLFQEKIVEMRKLSNRHDAATDMVLRIQKEFDGRDVESLVNSKFVEYNGSKPIFEPVDPSKPQSLTPHGVDPQARARYVEASWKDRTEDGRINTSKVDRNSFPGLTHATYTPGGFDGVRPDSKTAAGASAEVVEPAPDKTPAPEPKQDTPKPPAPSKVSVDTITEAYSALKDQGIERIVFYGDSHSHLTHAYNSSTIKAAGLGTLDLGHSGGGILNVGNTKLPSAKTSPHGKGLYDVTPIREGDLVYVSIGANDGGPMQSLAQINSTGPQGYGASFAKVLQSIEAEGGIPVVVGMPKPTDAYLGKLSATKAAEWLAKYEAIHAVEQKVAEAAGIQFHDYTQLSKTVAARSGDGLHMKFDRSKGIDVYGDKLLEPTLIAYANNPNQSILIAAEQQKAPAPQPQQQVQPSNAEYTTMVHTIDTRNAGRAAGSKTWALANDYIEEYRDGKSAYSAQIDHIAAQAAASGDTFYVEVDHADPDGNGKKSSVLVKATPEVDPTTGKVTTVHLTPSLSGGAGNGTLPYFEKGTALARAGVAGDSRLQAEYLQGAHFRDHSYEYMIDWSEPGDSLDGMSPMAGRSDFGNHQARLREGSNGCPIDHPSHESLARNLNGKLFDRAITTGQLASENGSNLSPSKASYNKLPDKYSPNSEGKTPVIRYQILPSVHRQPQLAMQAIEQSKAALIAQADKPQVAPQPEKAPEPVKPDTAPPAPQPQQKANGAEAFAAMALNLKSSSTAYIASVKGIKELQAKYDAAPEGKDKKVIAVDLLLAQRDQVQAYNGIKSSTEGIQAFANAAKDDPSLKAVIAEAGTKAVLASDIIKIAERDGKSVSQVIEEKMAGMGTFLRATGDKLPKVEIAADATREQLIAAATGEKVAPAAVPPTPDAKEPDPVETKGISISDVLYQEPEKIIERAKVWMDEPVQYVVVGPHSEALAKSLEKQGLQARHEDKPTDIEMDAVYIVTSNGKGIDLHNVVEEINGNGGNPFPISFNDDQAKLMEETSRQTIRVNPPKGEMPDRMADDLAMMSLNVMYDPRSFIMREINEKQEPGKHIKPAAYDYDPDTPLVYADQKTERKEPKTEIADTGTKDKTPDDKVPAPTPSDQAIERVGQETIAVNGSDIGIHAASHVRLLRSVQDAYGDYDVVDNALKTYNGRLSRDSKKLESLEENIAEMSTQITELGKQVKSAESDEKTKEVEAKLAEAMKAREDASSQQTELQGKIKDSEGHIADLNQRLVPAYYSLSTAQRSYESFRSQFSKADMLAIVNKGNEITGDPKDASRIDPELQVLKDSLAVDYKALPEHDVAAMARQADQELARSEALFRNDQVLSQSFAKAAHNIVAGANTLKERDSVSIQQEQLLLAESKTRLEEIAAEQGKLTEEDKLSKVEQIQAEAKVIQAEITALEAAATPDEKAIAAAKASLIEVVAQSAKLDSGDEVPLDEKLKQEAEQLTKDVAKFEESISSKQEAIKGYDQDIATYTEIALQAQQSGYGNALAGLDPEAGNRVGAEQFKLISDNLFAAQEQLGEAEAAYEEARSNDSLPEGYLELAQARYLQAKMGVDQPIAELAAFRESFGNDTKALDAIIARDVEARSENVFVFNSKGLDEKLSELRTDSYRDTRELFADGKDSFVLGQQQVGAEQVRANAATLVTLLDEHNKAQQELSELETELATHASKDGVEVDKLRTRHEEAVKELGGTVRDIASFQAQFDKEVTGQIIAESVYRRPDLATDNNIDLNAIREDFTTKHNEAAASLAKLDNDVPVHTRPLAEMIPLPAREQIAKAAGNELPVIAQTDPQPEPLAPAPVEKEDQLSEQVAAKVAQVKERASELSGKPVPVLYRNCEKDSSRLDPHNRIYQARLDSLGLDVGAVADGKGDGDFGRKTDKATETLQSAAGIKVDGIRGTATEAALFAAETLGWRPGKQFPEVVKAELKALEALPKAERKELNLDRISKAIAAHITGNPDMLMAEEKPAPKPEKEELRRVADTGIDIPSSADGKILLSDLIASVQTPAPSPDTRKPDADTKPPKPDSTDKPTDRKPSIALRPIADRYLEIVATYEANKDNDKFLKERAASFGYSSIRDFQEEVKDTLDDLKVKNFHVDNDPGQQTYAALLNLEVARAQYPNIDYSRKIPADALRTFIIPGITSDPKKGLYERPVVDAPTFAASDYSVVPIYKSEKQIENEVADFVDVIKSARIEDGRDSLILDLGHMGGQGGGDTGAAGHGQNEITINWPLVQEVATLAMAEGKNVYFSCETVDDQGHHTVDLSDLTFSERTTHANDIMSSVRKDHADAQFAYVSVHSNWASREEAQGVEVLTSGDLASTRVASLMVANMEASGLMPPRYGNIDTDAMRVVSPGMAGYASTKAAGNKADVALLFENGFVTSPSDMARLQQLGNNAKTAAAIYGAVKSGFDIGTGPELELTMRSNPENISPELIAANKKGAERSGKPGVDVAFDQRYYTNPNQQKVDGFEYKGGSIIPLTASTLDKPSIAWGHKDVSQQEFLAWGLRNPLRSGSQITSGQAPRHGSVVSAGYATTGHRGIDLAPSREAVGKNKKATQADAEDLGRVWGMAPGRVEKVREVKGDAWNNYIMVTGTFQEDTVMEDGITIAKAGSGYVARFYHMDDIFVKEGQYIDGNTALGYMVGTKSGKPHHVDLVVQLVSPKGVVQNVDPAGATQEVYADNGKLEGRVYADGSTIDDKGATLRIPAKGGGYTQTKITEVASTLRPERDLLASNHENRGDYPFVASAYRSEMGRQPWTSVAAFEAQRIADNANLPSLAGDQKLSLLERLGNGIGDAGSFFGGMGGKIFRRSSDGAEDPYAPSEKWEQLAESGIQNTLEAQDLGTNQIAYIYSMGPEIERALKAENSQLARPLSEDQILGLAVNLAMHSAPAKPIEEENIPRAIPVSEMEVVMHDHKSEEACKADGICTGIATTIFEETERGLLSVAAMADPAIYAAFSAEGSNAEEKASLVKKSKALQEAMKVEIASDDGVEKDKPEPASKGDEKADASTTPPVAANDEPEVAAPDASIVAASDGQDPASRSV